MGARPASRKDRVVQTRVPRELEAALKEEARRRRLSVSQLVRNVLEDTFHLVDGLVADVDRVVGSSVDLARNARDRARRIGRARGGAEADAARHRAASEADDVGAADPAEARPAPGGGASLDAVIAWNEVVLHRRVRCAACGAELPRGARGHLGLDEHGAATGAWLCERCLESL